MYCNLAFISLKKILRYENLLLALLYEEDCFHRAVSTRSRYYTVSYFEDCRLSYLQPGQDAYCLICLSADNIQKQYQEVPKSVSQSLIIEGEINLRSTFRGCSR